MHFVKFFRDDLVNPDVDVFVDYAIVNADDPHAMAIEAAKYRPTATHYQVFQGNNLRHASPISLRHAINC